ncbi:hypothetical protein OKA04_07235 [Luteolibacter flavescens]|uniref:Uncharacterized protein n=1 Tax=Luteolibacter flavescens TaxID=1859460 RepID=A0ABT3FLS1_9BACT|nr:hypothetical protein [Luteolibacter flavescens]MCW1884520.1 hypothetical protein [Luteolibacter flavescens]
MPPPPGGIESSPHPAPGPTRRRIFTGKAEFIPPEVVKDAGFTDDIYCKYSSIWLQWQAECHRGSKLELRFFRTPSLASSRSEAACCGDRSNPMARQSLFRKAVEKVAVPWASANDFARTSAHVFVRPSEAAGIWEVVELQKSVKNPYRTFTINLALVRTSSVGGQLPEMKKLIAADCDRVIRIGHVMSKNCLARAVLWLRFGCGWNWWQIFPTDFWWSYQERESSITEAMDNALSHAADHGFRWLREAVDEM